MGRLSRLNPHTTPEAQRQLTAEAHIRKLLALFPDRSTFEQWATAKALPDNVRAHMERHLPPHLQRIETVN